MADWWTSLDPQVQAAWISTIGSLITALIGVVVASGITWRINGRKKLEDDLARAKADIEFILEVEKVYGEKVRSLSGETFKNRIREQVERTGRFSWSGRFTPGRNRHSG